MVTKYRTIDIPTLAGNASFRYSPGKGMKFKIVYGKIYIDTDATVANRNLLIYVLDRDLDTIVIAPVPQSVITANLTGNWYIYEVPNWDEGTQVAGSGGIVFPSPIYETDILQIAISAGVAGDSYSGKLKIQECPINEDFHP